ncbi:MAG TPA: CHASE domain-containing protein [Gallionellaceae bacterium]
MTLPVPSRLLRYLPWLVLLAALAVTWQLWRNAQREPERDLQKNFNYRVLEIVNRLDERILSYEQVLKGVQALFISSGNVGGNEFRSYVSELHLDHNFPGMHGVTLALIRQAKAHGAYTALTYIEQYPGRNQNAFGYDVFARPELRAVMEYTVTTGNVAVTGKLDMAPEKDGRRQSGFLMYVPIYRKGGLNQTLEARRANVIGWVIASFRMSDLMFGLLGDSASDLDVEIFDGEQMSAQTLLYDPDFSNETGSTRNAWMKSVVRVEVAGHPWTMSISSLPDFEARLDQAKAQLIAETGSGISILLALLTWLLVRGRARAVQAAREISASEAKLHAILDNSPIGIWLVGMDGRYRFVNRAFCEALGVTEQQFLSRPPEETLGAETSANLARSDLACLRSESPCRSRETMTFADGKPHLLEITKALLSDKEGGYAGVIGIMIDITEENALQQALLRSRDELEMRVAERTHDLAATAARLETEIGMRRKLERKILEISEEEQARIGRELHDDLGQLLTGAAYLAGALSSRLAASDSAASQQAGEIKQVTQDAIKRTRYISHGLVPFNLASQGLKQGLEQLAKDMASLSGIPCELRCSSAGDVSDFMVATHLYRIAQEALNNAVKHSGASQLTIALSIAPEEISLSVADNGSGLGGEAREAGLGMLNMNYRAQIIGATLAVESQPGQGTLVSLRLPLAH